MANRPSAVAFDVVETLMSLQPLAARFVDVGQPASALPGWFARLLLYGVGLSAAGDYVSFEEAAAEALRAISGYQLDEAAVEHVLAGFAQLPAHPDAEPAMRALAEGGVRMICLTNGSATTTAAFLHRTGLAAYIERVVSTAGPEIGELLGITRQRVFQLQATDNFPAPLVPLRTGPVWDRRAIEAYPHATERRPRQRQVTAAG